MRYQAGLAARPQDSGAGSWQRPSRNTGPATTAGGVRARLLDVRSAADLQRARQRTHAQLAAEAAGFVTFSFDRGDGGIVFSAEALRLIGLPAHEPLTFDAYLRLVPSPDRASLGLAIARSQRAAGPRRLDVEHRLVQPSTGEVRWIALRALSTLGDDGHVQTLDGVLVDITDLKQTERAIACERALYESVLDHTDGETVLLDRQGRHVYISPTAVPDAALRRWLIGRTDADRARRETEEPSVAARRARALQQVMDTQAPARYQETHLGAGGEARHWLRIVAPICAPGGAMTHVSIRSIDLTEVREAQLEFRRATIEAERTRQSLLDNMNHEIRTPLTAVIGGAQILGSELTGDDAALARQIERGGFRLLRLLEGIMDLAHLSGEHESPPRTLADVSALVARVADTVVPDADARGLSLTLDTKPSARAWIQPEALARALSQLLDNAISFTPDGCVQATVEVEPDAVVVRIADTGIGMEPGQVERLSLPFVQGSEGRCRSHEGAGIGLAVARGLIEEMGGVLTLASEPGMGTTATVRLERDAADRPEDDCGA